MDSGNIVEIGADLYSMVRKGGVEPPRTFAHTLLKRTRLPVPPLPLLQSQVYTYFHYKSIP